MCQLHRVTWAWIYMWYSLYIIFSVEMWNRILQVFVNRPDDKHYKSILWISQLGKGQLDRPQHCTTLWAEIGRAGRTSDMNPPAVLETSIHQGRLSPSIGELSLATFFWDKCYIYTFLGKWQGYQKQPYIFGIKILDWTDLAASAPNNMNR